MKVTFSRGLTVAQVPRSAAFTRLELLVLIFVLTVLLLLAIPFGRDVNTKAKSCFAISGTTILVTGVMSYHVDYGRYPSPPDCAAKNDFYYAPRELNGFTNEKLINVLRCPTGYANPQNPNGIKYLLTPPARNPAAPVSGIVETTVGDIPAGSFVDPWGKPYVVFIDGDLDGHITVDKVFTSGFSWGTVPRCGAASVGLYSQKKNNGAVSPHALDRTYDLISWL